MYRHGHHSKPQGGRRLRTYIVAAIVFLAFFAISNYYMGLFSAASQAPRPSRAGRPPIPDIALIKSKPPKKEPEAPIPEIPKAPFTAVADGNPNKIEQVAKEGSAPNAPPPPLPASAVVPVVPKGSGIKYAHAGYYDDEEVSWSDIKPDPNGCKRTRLRDYDKDPIVIGGRFGGRENCDVPCVGDGGSPDAAVGGRGGQCPVKSIFFTMENSIPSPGSYDIIANTQMTCDVPLPYFSWAEYKFAHPVSKKTAPAHIAAFISNCGPQRRLQWMETMMKHGIKIDSYGACMRNKNVPSELQAKHGSNYNGLKVELISQYKFTMAFENSHTDDYVTEKLFGVLVAGSVPLYDGASNGKAFGPAAKSMIFAADYETPEKLAEYLLYLDGNDTAYEEYLQWKKTGPSDDWVAMIDLANVHSNCRLCIRTADLHRKEIGPVKNGQQSGEKKPEGVSLELHVRERGKFWMHKIYLTSLTIDHLKEKINEFVPHDEKSYLHSMQELWSRKRILTDTDVATLPAKMELEAIFVVPQDWKGLNLMW